ncbi:hypothetical protein ABVT39_011313 [Epinephelus coioides]
MELAVIPHGVQAAISCANLYQAVPAYGSAQTTVRKTAFNILWEIRTGPSLPLLWSQKRKNHYRYTSQIPALHQISQIKRCWECMAKVDMET